MSQLQPAITRHPRIIAATLSAFSVIFVLVIGCDRAGQKGSVGSGFVEARVDTITVRDTTVVVEWEVVKRVEVPAEVPPHYERAWQKQVAEVAADFSDEKTCFSGLDSIEVSVGMDEEAEDILSNQRAKDKFELTLRRYRVPLSDSSNPYLSLSVDALWNEDKTRTTYVIRVGLVESLVFWRNKKPHKRFVTLWEHSSFGYAGKNVAREGFLKNIEEQAERVANLYLSAN